MERTISVTIGNGCLKHNNRVFVAENVDADRISQNVVFVQRDLRGIYHELFDEAVEEYNAKQKRKDRIIQDYYNKIKDGHQEHLFTEVIVQIGNMNINVNIKMYKSSKIIMYIFPNFQFLYDPSIYKIFRIS